MPEAPEETEKEKTSKILEFFSTSGKDVKKEKVKPLTKIVVRRLPPRLTKEVFLIEFTLPPHDYFYFVRGDLALGGHSFSRAYVNFASPEDIFAFKEKYDDHPLHDEQGREYHAVVEWAPVQRVPKKGATKKPSKSGTLETDPKYTEFLEKMEKDKNNAGNSSEYFMETDNILTKEAKITTTPLLEYIKLKRQQKMDIRNESRLRKREAEKERRRKEDEMRKADKMRKSKEKEKLTAVADHKDEETPDRKEKEMKTKKYSKDEYKATACENKENKSEKVVRPEKVEKSESKPASRREEKLEKREKPPRKETSEVHKPRDKEADNFSSRHKKEFVDDRKGAKSGQPVRKSNPPAKPVSSQVYAPKVEPVKPTAVKTEVKIDRNLEESKREPPARSGETKSKFRYSEQRNRDREVRNQKSVQKDSGGPTVETAKPAKEEEKKDTEGTVSAPGERIRRQSTQETSDGSAEGEDSKPGDRQRSTGGRKDPRTERRIRNKDRPSIQIYQPGMGKFSKQRMEHKKDDSEPDAASELRREELSEPEEKTELQPIKHGQKKQNSHTEPKKEEKKCDESENIPEVETGKDHKLEAGRNAQEQDLKQPEVVVKDAVETVRQQDVAAITDSVKVEGEEKEERTDKVATLDKPDSSMGPKSETGEETPASTVREHVESVAQVESH